MNRKLYIFIIFTVLLSLTACTRKQKSYRIAVSQCSEGRWRNKANQEMLAAQHLYEQDAKVTIVNSYDDTELQIRQIDSLAKTDIDLLVVAPNEAAPVTEAIQRVRARGIPVIFFDRKAATDDYTAFIGGNNVEAGYTMGCYAVEMARKQHSGGRPVVLEITGAMSSTPAQERHQGFAKAIQGTMDMEYISEESDWTSEGAYEIAKRYLSSDHHPIVIFAHNDGMATGVYKATVETGKQRKTSILGIDGMPDEGLEYVRLGHQVGTYVYPTHGEEIVRLALDILSGKDYQRDNALKGMLVTPENVEVVTNTSTELMAQNNNLITIQDKLEEYFGLYNLQHKIIFVGAGAFLLLLAAVILIWRAVRQTRKANKRIQALHDEQTAFYNNARHQLRTPLTLVAGPLKQFVECYPLKDSQQELMDIISRNVTQLETIVTDVLNFRKEQQPLVDDDNASAVLRQRDDAETLQENRLAQFKQEDTEELSSVLIVDDNSDMRRYLRTILSDKFYVIEASDGQGGLNIAKELVPDIIVSDVMMPVMDGLLFCRKIKEDAITCHIPVILLTARSTDTQQVEGYEHGADAYLIKPFNADVLAARIYNLLKNRQQLRHLAEDRQEEQPKLSTQDTLFTNTMKSVFLKYLSNPDLKMDDLGRELGMSRVQLYRKVKALTGISPVELLREMRLQRGYTLINTTTKSINEIAYEVGFHTPSYFSNCFKKHFGKYPTEMRG